MSTAVDSFLLIVATLFPVVDPVGAAPIFYAMTRDGSAEVRRVLARRVALGGFVLLVVALLVGAYVLEFLGISLAAVRVAGGLVISVTAWHLLHQPHDDRDKVSLPSSDRALLRHAFYPLTLPLTMGPGSIAIAITLGSHRPDEPLAQIVEEATGALAGVAAIALSVYFCLRYAHGIERLLGEIGPQRHAAPDRLHPPLHRHPEPVVGRHRPPRGPAEHPGEARLSGARAPNRAWGWTWSDLSVPEPPARAMRARAQLSLRRAPPSTGTQPKGCSGPRDFPLPSREPR